MKYTPKPLSSAYTSLAEFVRYVYDELQEVSRILNLQHEFILDETHVAPAKPREGMIRFADGTNWNPGAGKGIYGYYGGSWTKL